jgi:dephospho-CoA kinase
MGMSGMIPVIGLAGGIASGKSRVGEEFARLGCVVIDYDELVRAALETPAVRETFSGWWGDEILDADGCVDRGAVARIVFADPGERERLEGLLHPIVIKRGREMIKQAVAGGEAMGIVLDAPLLFEAGLDDACDAIVFVEAQFETRLDRVVRKRGWTREGLTQREAAQMPLGEKRLQSDYEVVNDEDKDALRRQVGAVFATLSGRQGSDAG